MAGNYKNYLPIADWTGCLVLPSLSERRTDGGVFFTIDNAPSEFSEMKGKTVWLTWKIDTDRDWFDSETVDIRFTGDTEISISEKNIHPHRINGWERVSPLETLAGSRPDDDIIVSVSSPEISVNNNDYILSIDREPVQICGTHYGLVVFKRSVNESEFQVVHFDKEENRFGGEEETVSILDIPIREDFDIPQASLKGIENHELNGKGWYIYGMFQGEHFIVHALKPRALFQLNYTERIKGVRKTKHYINIENFGSPQKGTAKRILLDGWNQKSEFEVDPYTMIQEGNSYLMIHLFGWIGGAKGEKPKRLGIVSGHSSPGIASIVTDPLTGELQWDIEYKQVYCHNREGIVAGSIKWHCYMGSLKRGWMNLVPVSDAILLHPALSKSYEFDGHSFSPVKEIERSLYKIMARMRSGGGCGLSPVNMARSCSQDTAMTFDSCFRLITKEYFNRKTIKDWIKGNPTHEQAVHFHQLMALFIKWENYFKPFLIAPRRWRAYHRNKVYYRMLPQPLSHLIAAILTLKSILPRSLHDGIAKVVLDSGGAVWLLRSNQLGGENEGIEPLWPTTFRRRQKTKTLS